MGFIRLRALLIVETLLDAMLNLVTRIKNSLKRCEPQIYSAQKITDVAILDSYLGFIY